MENRKSSRNLVIGLTLMVLVVWNLAASPGVYPAGSKMVRITGYLLPSEETGAPGAYTLRYGDQDWTFRLTDVWMPRSQPQDTSDYAVMKRLGRERLNLLGRDDVIGQLNHPDMACKEITLTGTIYTSNNAMALHRIDAASEKKPVGSCI